MLKEYLRKNWSLYLEEIVTGRLLAQTLAAYLGLPVETIVCQAMTVMLEKSAKHSQNF